MGHFRRFVANFSKIARPLHLHLEGDTSKLKAQKVKFYRNAKESFNLLKQALLMTPVLKFADYSKPFMLETGASSNRLGAVLLQADDDGKLHPIAYGSRSLTKAECNYQSGKLEFLCAKWAVMDQFKEDLLYQLFNNRTDNNPLTYIATNSNLDAFGHQWVAALANYNFTLEYQKGKNNVAADALSQVTGRLIQEEVKAILDGSKIGCLQ